MAKLIAILNVIAWSGFWAFGYLALSADADHTGHVTVAVILAALGRLWDAVTGAAVAKLNGDVLAECCDGRDFLQRRIPLRHRHLCQHSSRTTTELECRVWCRAFGVILLLTFELITDGAELGIRP